MIENSQQPQQRGPDRSSPRSDQLRVLVATHSHPEISNGGAEICASQLFRHLMANANTEVWFLGCDRQHTFARAGAPFIQPFSEQREYLYSAGEFDWLRFANRDPNFPDAFAELLRELAPDVVHFHHYAVFGVEAFAHVKRVLPAAKIVLTLHEFLAICNHYGQMVTRPDRSLCYAASPLRCSRCFPEMDRSDFFLRKTYIERFFGLVDHFVSPSRFLAERYVAWGIPETKISVIENLLPPRVGEIRRPNAPPKPLRIGFFGQISWLKGINVLLEAAEMLIDEEAIRFEIFGDYRNQPPEFQKDFQEQLAKMGSNAHFHGPYDQIRLDQLMQSVDAIVVPSIWWENSPLVIQEAFRNKTPVICSNIGGMAEKVRDGLDGFHFPVGNAVELAGLLRRLAADPERLQQIAATIQTPAPPETIRDIHLALYRRLCADAPAVAG